ncbi:globin domain-containing protein [Streptacidiphilus sp. PAMC 29251]
MPAPGSVDPALITWSFSVVERRAEQLSRYFYSHLFHHNPGVREMFPARMEEQRDRLFAALTTAATHVADTDTLVAYLRDLGFDHRKFGTLPEHYPAVGASLVATLKYFCGAAWTPEIEASWVAAYGIISEVMIAAAAEVPASVPSSWDGEVVQHERHGADLAVLTVRPRQPYPFVPGQYATLTVPELPQVWRPYSVANAPRADGTLDFHVRRVPGGLLSTVLVEQVGKGGAIRLGPALGTMRLPADRAPGLLLIAGGTGWAPTKALVEAAGSAAVPYRLRLLLTATSEEAVYDVTALERLVGDGLQLELIIEEPPRAGEAESSGAALLRELTRYGSQLRRLTAPDEWPETFVSGPAAMVDAVRVQLEALLGVPPQRIHYDPYESRSRSAEPAKSRAEWLLMRRQRTVPWIRPR